MRRAEQGFTLTEIVVVVLIIGITVGLFNTVFINNWSAYEDRIQRANLWSEANQLFEQMSIDGRNARLIDVSITANTKTALFHSGVDTSTITYRITDTGNVSRVRNDITKIFSTHAVFADSDFTKSGKDLIVNLRLRENALMRDIHITASTEILPRN